MVHRNGGARTELRRHGNGRHARRYPDYQYRHGFVEGTYTSAASAADDLEFFNATSGGTRITSFTPNAAGCDAAVRRIEINPKGIFASGDSISPQPSFVLRFRACIK